MNAYSLTKDGVRHKLNLLKDTKEKVCGNARISFVNGRKFLEGMRHENMCFALIPKSDKQEVEDVPVEVEDLLNEFQDIVF